MATADEAANARTPLGADLKAGVDQLSLNQEITFTRYVRLILPLDGYAFWVRADLVSAGALYNATKFNATAYNKPPRVVSAAKTLVAKGSFHYATETHQDEAETFGVNRVVFTSEIEVQDLNEIAPNELYVGEFEGVRFAFSSRGSFYRQADLFHYVGVAVYPDMATQLVDSLVGFDRSLVVSNSLPVWLSLNGYNPFYGYGNPSLPIYPSFLVPDNIEPPFAAVHIAPENTRALTATQHLDQRSSIRQLVADKVRVTIWGTRNVSALDFVACVNQYSADYGVIGMMNQPVVRDEKRTQAELATIAMKKTVEFEVSYYQERINDVARQMILSAIPAFNIGGLVKAA
jgi:hypothetical protein